MASNFKRKSSDKFDKAIISVEVLKRKTNNSNKIENNGSNGNGNGHNGVLTYKQSKFVGELLSDPKANGTRAVIRAGYSEKGAEVRANELLSNIKIQKALEKGRERLTAKFRIDQEWVLKRYEMLADYSIDDFINDDGSMKSLSEIPKEKLYAIGGFKQSKKTITTKDEEFIIDRIKEFKLPDKKSVLDSIRNQLGFEANGNKDNPLGPTIGQMNIQVNLIKRD